MFSIIESNGTVFIPIMDCGVPGNGFYDAVTLAIVFLRDEANHKLVSFVETDLSKSAVAIKPLTDIIELIEVITSAIDFTSVFLTPHVEYWIGRMTEMVKVMVIVWVERELLEMPKAKEAIEILKTIRKKISLPDEDAIFTILFKRISDIMYRNQKARVIQRCFRRAITNPYNILCLRRLHHEWMDMHWSISLQRV